MNDGHLYPNLPVEVLPKQQRKESKVQHTPGPWKAIGTKAFGLSEVVATRCDFNEGHLVCTVNRNFFVGGNQLELLPRAQVEANALLLAAAPDYRAALEEIAALADATQMRGDLAEIGMPASLVEEGGWMPIDPRVKTGLAIAARIARKVLDAVEKGE